MIVTLFNRIQVLFGKPLFWFVVIQLLVDAFCLNLWTRGQFDPGMNYSNFLQNLLQLVALAVSCVSLVSLADRHEDLHDKIDGLK